MNTDALNLEPTATPAARGLAWMLSGFGPQIHLAPENGSGSGGSEEGDSDGDAGDSNKSEDDAAKSEENKDGADKGDGKQMASDAEARLLKEVMEKKEKLRKAEAAAAEAAERLKQFDGVDLNEYRSLKQAKADAEKEEAERKGEFDRVKKMMAEEHAKELEALKSQTTAKDELIAKQSKIIDELTIGGSFSSSTFIKEDLVLTPSKARTVYGSHFAVEDGKTVAYDKPAGESDRTKLVDASGEPLGFDAAMRKLVEADPDRDAILKSKAKPGAESKTADATGKPKAEDDASLHGVGRIMAGLGKLEISKTRK